MGVLRRLPLDHVVEATLACTIVLFACGSSSVPDLFRFGGPARWVGLAALGVVVFGWALVDGRRPRRLPGAWLLAAGFVALCLLSAAWSVSPRLTVERTATLSVLLAIACLAAVAALGREDGMAAVLRGILGGAALVAVAGLLVLAFDHHAAVQSADAGSGWRFRGLGENPNTSSMLFAVALPLTVWLLAGRSRREQLVGAALGLLFSGSIAVSGSRGALVAGFAGAAVVAASLPATRRARAVLLALVAVVFVVSGVVSKLPKPVSLESTFAKPRPAQRKTVGIDLQNLIRLEDEIGRPPGGAYRPPQQRRFFSFGARGAGWGAGLHQGAKRPVTGYGFGTEGRVFVDRSSIFLGGLPENSYIGVFLQIGLVGLLLFLALVGALARNGVEALRRLPVARRAQPVVAGAVLLVALILGIGQSSLYSVGNIATVSIWLCALALPMLLEREVRP